MFMCLFVPFNRTKNHMDWRLLVKKCITRYYPSVYHGRILYYTYNPSVFHCKILYISDRCHMTHDMSHVTCDTGYGRHKFFVLISFLGYFWYWCYYLHTSRHSVSSVHAGLFLHLHIMRIEVYLPLPSSSPWICVHWALTSRWSFTRREIWPISEFRSLTRG